MFLIIPTECSTQVSEYSRYLSTNMSIWYPLLRMKVQSH